MITIRIWITFEFIFITSTQLYLLRLFNYEIHWITLYISLIASITQEFVNLHVQIQKKQALETQ